MKKLITSVSVCFAFLLVFPFAAIGADFTGTYELKDKNQEGYLEIRKEKNGSYSAQAYEYYDRGDRGGINTFFVGENGKMAGKQIVFEVPDSKARVLVDFSNINNVRIKRLYGDIIGWQKRYDKNTYKPYKSQY